MKITCEKCQKDISGQCFKKIETFEVGKVICPHCHFEQKRYISQSDLLLYFAANEFIYMSLSYLIFYLTNKFSINTYIIIVIILTFILYFIFSKYIVYLIYDKAIFKENIKNKTFNEDQLAIKRYFNWQFMLFFAICFSYLTIPEARIFFAFAMPLAVIFTLIKYYLQLNNEKHQ